MARNRNGSKSSSAFIIALFAMLATAAFSQSPALVPRDSQPFTPPDMKAPPPRAANPTSQPVPPQSAPAQVQPPAGQSPVSQGIATVAPAPLMQKPAVPPVVNMQNGLLSIDASNSNLSDVLNAVRRATGATIEGGSGASERVVVHLGPGRPNEVISALLNGSRYDYVLLGSAQQPGAVTRVMLSVRQGGDQTSPQQGVPQAASNVRQPQPVSSPEDEGAQDDTPEQREQDARQPEPPPTAVPQGQQQGQPGQPQNAAQPGAENSDQPKTPQQLFEEIQRMQQQRQQEQQGQQGQQQQQTPPPPDE